MGIPLWLVSFLLEVCQSVTDRRRFCWCLTNEVKVLRQTTYWTDSGWLFSISVIVTNQVKYWWTFQSSLTDARFAYDWQKNAPQLYFLYLFMGLNTSKVALLVLERLCSSCTVGGVCTKNVFVCMKLSTPSHKSIFYSCDFSPHMRTTHWLRRVIQDLKGDSYVPILLNQ